MLDGQVIIYFSFCIATGYPSSFSCFRFGKQCLRVCDKIDGRILRIDPERSLEETIADTGGRPLGLEVLWDGHLLICDAQKGLLRLDPETGVIETLVQYVDGVTLRFCSNAAAARDGTIWFTESSSRYDFEQYTGALMEHRPSGLLFSRDPDGCVEIVL